MTSQIEHVFRPMFGGGHGATAADPDAAERTFAGIPPIAAKFRTLQLDYDSAQREGHWRRPLRHLPAAHTIDRMKYVCLVYLEESKLHAVPDRECLACGDGLAKAGVLVAAEALQPVRTARSLRIRNGQTIVTDGPFTETKEMLAGFYLIEAANDDEALQIAGKIPPAREGTIEIRPVRTLEP